MKYIFIFALAILSFFSLASPVRSAENNKFGIHVIQPSDLEKAAELVNSNGGDWGYITITIQEGDMDSKKWQNFFDTCRELHLIPLVRISTHPENDMWAKPTIDIISVWARFLSSLNWPIKNKYVIIYNEPNHISEWGGQINPKEYAQILNEAITRFKETDHDFFILNAGFDQAAPNSKTTMDEIDYLREMEKEIPGIFSKLDGWLSHSYPNHGFIGKPTETGKASVKGYDWELNFLKKEFEVQRDYKVFITETGWPHNIKTYSTYINPKTKKASTKVTTLYSNYYDEETAANYLKQAFENIWLKDDRVVSVTPFIINYPNPPFDTFSWMDVQGHTSVQFDTIKNIKKVSGKPEQNISFKILEFDFPRYLPANFVFTGKLVIQNTGQNIWGENPFIIKLNTPVFNLKDMVLEEGKLVKPNQKTEFTFNVESPATAGDYEVSYNNLPIQKTRVFEAWKLTENKDTFFNRLSNVMVDTWYTFKAIFNQTVIRP